MSGALSVVSLQRVNLIFGDEKSNYLSSLQRIPAEIKFYIFEFRREEKQLIWNEEKILSKICFSL